MNEEEIIAEIRGLAVRLKDDSPYVAVVLLTICGAITTETDEALAELVIKEFTKPMIQELLRICQKEDDRP